MTFPRLTLIAALAALPFFVGLGMRYGWTMAALFTSLPMAGVVIGWIAGRAHLRYTAKRAVRTVDRIMDREWQGDETKHR